MDWKTFVQEYTYPLVLVLLALGLVSMMSCSTFNALTTQTKAGVEVFDEAGAEFINTEAKVCNKNGKVLRGDACRE